MKAKQETFNTDDFYYLVKVAKNSDNPHLKQQFFEFKENNKDKYDKNGRLKHQPAFVNQLKQA